MEKLIELLNEFDKPHYGQREYEERNQVFYSGEYDFYKDVPDYKLISKRFGFIKWLVDNDKVDFESQAMQYAKEDLSKFLNERKDKNGMSDEYAMILMLLSIQDKPIEFLISILK